MTRTVLMNAGPWLPVPPDGYGGIENVIAALVEARKRGVRTVAFVGYDGGRVAAEGLADHVVVSRSQHIPRIQEAQASAYHILLELLDAA